MYRIKAFSFVIILFIPSLLLSQEHVVSTDSDVTCSVDHIPFDIVEKAPIYPGCAEQDSSELKNCFSDAISRFITENLNLEIESTENYPPESIRMFSRFVINKEGYITDINVRALNKSLEKEVIRVIKKLPQMIPGKQKGKSVAVLYNFPMIFCVK